MKNYYEILGLDRDCLSSEVKAAYRTFAKKWHPDVNHSPDAQEKFIEICEAYEFLIDPRKRRYYDALYAQQSQGAAQSPQWDEYYTYQSNAQKQAKSYSEMTYEDYEGSILKVLKTAGKVINTGHIVVGTVFRFLAAVGCIITGFIPLVTVADSLQDISSYSISWLLEKFIIGCLFIVGGVFMIRHSIRS